MIVYSQLSDTVCECECTLRGAYLNEIRRRQQRQMPVQPQRQQQPGVRMRRLRGRPLIGNPRARNAGGPLPRVCER